MKKLVNKNYIKRILAIAIPIMLSSLISQLQMMIDRIFIGRLSLESMSAVGNATTPMWTTMDIIFSLTTGATILVSQAYGAGENEKAQKIIASLFNFLVFMVSGRKRIGISKAQQMKRKEFRAKTKSLNNMSRNVTKHKCAICGRTDESNPELEFRFCSKCNGNYEYCNDHLFTHKHVE